MSTVTATPKKLRHRTLLSSYGSRVRDTTSRSNGCAGPYGAVSFFDMQMMICYVICYITANYIVEKVISVYIISSLKNDARAPQERTASTVALHTPATWRPPASGPEPNLKGATI